MGEEARRLHGKPGKHKEITPVFCALAAYPSVEDVENWLYSLERFVVLLYDRTSSKILVNEARKELFTHRGRAIDALFLHLFLRPMK